MIKKLLLSCLFICCSLTVQNTEAATLHAILIGDTMEGGCIDASTGSSLDLMQREAKRIAIYTDLDLEMAVFEGYHVSEENILNYIDALEVGRDDLMIFCCYTHGTRERDKQSKWPNLAFTLDKIFFQKRTDFGLFIEHLQKKQPRLFIALTEACNEYLLDEDFNWDDDEDDEDEITDPEQLRQIYETIVRRGPMTKVVLDRNVDHFRDMLEEDDKEVYMKLFLEPTGSILISGSKPGETSLRDPYVTGGLLTQELLRALRTKKIFFPDSLSWAAILEEASKAVSEHPMQKEIDHIQTPQFEINLH